MKEWDEQVREVAEKIKKADALVVCAGAGMGVDSGLPDFRGNQGFWQAYPPFARLGYSFVEMANPEWFVRDPGLAWGFYGHRLGLYRETIPHDGFKILLQWGESKPGGYFVFTSNVDGQFQVAGFEEKQVLECHGSIHYLQCREGGCRSSIWPAEGIEVEVDETTMRARPPLPVCQVCGAVARPNVLMFGDWGWISDRTDEQERRFNQWLMDRKGHRLVVIECGAGTGVPTVRMASEGLVYRMNAFLARINLRESQTPPGQLGLPLGALEALERIDKQLKNL